MSAGRSLAQRMFADIAAQMLPLEIQEARDIVAIGAQGVADWRAAHARREESQSFSNSSGERPIAQKPQINLS